jgi:uncharacterized protein YciI
MPMFVAISTYLIPLSEVDQQRDAHLEWVGDHYGAGDFLVSGRQTPPVGGVIIARAASHTHLLAMLADDPFVRNDVLRYEITEFTPTPAALATPGFSTFWSTGEPAK